ncbi:histone-lysine n-methyltransferase [Diaporthe amygdali]|uniref:histone-lysine n-methyltransferase n=1 Tax=Phomopsis amygdali TaxID=1214568 RepID=UPI0022FECB7F|nr:histone-lysine n-methyltransferase [Diaporthe amygdali]KAJ0123406.1 histone-lysine n-methyltransferase [Diaporthe amygdali]
MAGLLTETAQAELPRAELLPLPTPEPALVPDSVELPALPSESSFQFSGFPTDASSNNASFTSTPPTTVADAASVASDTSKHEITATLPALDPPAALTPATGSAEPSEPTEHIEQTVQVATDELPETGQQTPKASTPAPDDETPTPRRARLGRVSSQAPVYNLAKLAGTHIHGKRRANGDSVREKRRRTISGDTLVGNNDASINPSLDSIVQRGVDALDMNWSLSAPNSPSIAHSATVHNDAKTKSAANNKKYKAKTAPTTRISTRASGAAAAESIITKAASVGKRGRKMFENARIPRELRRLQDTNEFIGVEAKPVLHTIWSNGKYVDPNELDEAGEPVQKKVKRGRAATQPEPETETETSKEETPTIAPKQKRVKKWLDKGLYAGQPAPLDYTKGMSTAEKKKLAQLPELAPTGKVNKTFPLPMFAGLRLLINGRDFKLPFDVCNPLPPGQPKPDEWRKMTKNRFVGDAGTYWRKTDHFKDYQSKCICKPDDGCTEDCQNRIMLYECDDTNCNAGKEYCHNRAFQNLTARTKKGGRYRVGVEVVKTSDRGYGVRSNRCFEPNQIIMEYTGEIITQAECENRMNEKYKDNECYYLMAFDQNMIIDATTGSIARFVNHSCAPNCRMEKWIVGGQPRMALFAGEKPIMTGDELTYDYNFDPFSAKNVQKCLCGSANCRGVLGPKAPTIARGETQVKAVKGSIKDTVKAATKAGKRKLMALLEGEEDTGTSNKKRKVIKATGVKRSLSAKAAAAVKKTANSISVNAKAALSSSAAQKTPVKTVSVRKSTLVKAARTYNKNGKELLLAASLTSSSATVVAKPAAGKSAGPGRKRAVKGSALKGSVAKAKGGIKGNITSAAGKGSFKSTIKSAKHTINKSTGRKTATTKTTKTVKTVKTKQIAKKSILEDAEEGKATKKYAKTDRAPTAEAGSISVKGPRKALELSRTQNKIRVVTDPE